MKTIQERAKEYASKKAEISLSAVYNEALARIYEEGYISGAEEQRRLDISRAFEWFRSNSIYLPFSSKILREKFIEHMMKDTIIE